MCICVYGWGVLEGGMYWEGGREENLHHYIIFVIS